MREELQDVSYTYQVSENVYEHEGKTILNLWKTLYKLQDIYKVNFWDYYGSASDFDNWCDLKGYGELDTSGKRRGESNIWYKEYQSDIANGTWKELPYCPFIDMFMDDIEDLGNDESDEIYEVNFASMMERAIEEDKKQFGKNDYRVHLTFILIAELGDIILVDQE